MFGSFWERRPLRPGRDGFGEAMLELGEKDPRVVALTADLAESHRVHTFGEKYPGRLFQLGVAEQDMIGTAAGLALSGKIPFATTFAVFATARAHEQVRLAVCYNRANVKIATSHGGITAGEDGATHQGLEDIALMRALPHMTVVAPCDANEAYHATLAAARYDGPVYLRLGRIASPVVTEKGDPFALGKAKVMRQGTDVTLVACGLMVGMALEAAEILAKEGISAEVINMHTIKPLDIETLLRSAAKTRAVVTAEEHSVIGGLGGAVAEALALHLPTPIRFVGTQDTFGESATPRELLEKYGLTPVHIVEAAKVCIAAKSAVA